MRKPSSSLIWAKGKPRPLPTEEEALIRRLLENPQTTFGGPWLEWLKARLELEPPAFLGGDLPRPPCCDEGAGFGCWRKQILDVNDPAINVLLWQMQEASGLPADTSGNGNDAVSSNGSFTYGATGPFLSEPSLKAIEFTPAVQASGTITTGDDFTLPVTDIAFGGTSAFTVEGFIQIDTLPATRMGVWGVHDGTNGWKIRVLSTGFVEFVRGADTLTSIKALAADKWYHLAATYDGTNMRLFINGIMAGLKASGSMTAGTEGYVGTEKGATNYAFDGWMAGLAMWAEAQPAAQIASRANCMGWGTQSGWGKLGIGGGNQPPPDIYVATGQGNSGEGPGATTPITGTSAAVSSGTQAEIPTYKYWYNRGWRIFARGAFQGIASLVSSDRVEEIGAFTKDENGTYLNGAIIQSWPSTPYAPNDYISPWVQVDPTIDASFGEQDTIIFDGYMDNSSGFFDTSIGEVYMEFKWFPLGSNPGLVDGSTVPLGGSKGQTLMWDAIGNTWTPTILDRKFELTSADMTLDDNDDLILVDASGANRTITLPDATDYFEQTTGAKVYTIKKIDSSANRVIIDGTGADTIDGQALYYLNQQYDSVTIMAYSASEWLVIEEARRREVLTKTGTAYTAVPDDEVILVDASGAARTITLFAASGLAGTVLTIKKIDSGDYDVTIDANGAETIDGATTYVLYGEDESVTIVCDGSNWHVIAHDAPKWRPYTPTWTASVTNPTIGNGTITGRYRKMGKTVDVRIRIDIGGTTTVGSGTYQVSLPFTARSGHYQPGGGLVYDASANQTFFMFLRADGYVMDAASAPAAFWTDAVPFVPANTDFFEFNITYEEA